MTVYIIALVGLLAIAAVALEFAFWLEKEVRETNLWEPPSMEPRNAEKLQAQQDAWEAAFLAQVAPRPYGWKRNDSA